ncbi:MAG: adenylate/guanylate cyclase domain-containing protein [Planctomycetota bacterium]
MFALKSHKIITGLLLGLLVGLLVKICFALLPFLQNVELLTLDYRFRLLAKPSEANRDIILIMIDQASLDYLEYQMDQREPQFWPWERFVYANLLDYLRPGRPKAIIFDLNFKRTDEEGDDRFADAIKKSGNVYCPTVFTQEKEERYTRIINDADKKIFLDKFSVEPDGLSHFDVPGYNMVMLPNSTLLETPKRLGAANINKDKDGVLRKTSLFYKYESKISPSLSMAVALDIILDGKINLSPNGHLPLPEEKKIPLSQDGNMHIWWYGTARTYRYIPFSELADDWYYAKTGRPDKIHYQPDYFKDKIIFVGTNAPTLGDLHTTPMGSAYPGVEVHATILNNLMTGQCLTPSPDSVNWLITLSLCLLTGFLLFSSRSFWSGGVLICLLIVLVLISSGYTFFEFHYWMDLTAPLSGIFLTFTSSALVYYFTEGKEKRRIKMIFSKYLAPEVVEEVLKDYKNLKADAGERKELTVLFSDIRGFTTISESLSPEQVVHLLNEYLQRMVRIIFHYGGTLDKYMGDGIMAFFGAPKEQANNAWLAVRTAQEMIKEARQLQEKWAREGKPHLNIGIGINTGEVVVGNIGSEQRLDYTVIGDNVNLASRLESLNKEYGSNIIISQATAQKLAERQWSDGLRTPMDIGASESPAPSGNEQSFGFAQDGEIAEPFELKELGTVKIKGKEKLIVIYEVKV